ncbi:FAD binding domain-containing protein [Pigmentiphaga humi]|uniref:FAD binding domain-containing protein n=1 Tax=Pigmentiphaga humi TaxID=2478468 RepID=UPI000F54354A|nr:FAD binding domain-containing protein [Pigmentiphaga humi]
MKAAPFDYVRAEGLDHALELLHQHGYDAKLLAGGQSLVPMMAMRLARPALLVDIHRVSALQSLSVMDDRVETGAAVRQRTLEYDLALHEKLPLVAKALRWVGHDQTRNRGTVGGSLVHADPSAELPLAALVLQARLHLCSRDEGRRSVEAADFFLGPMFTETRDTECLAAIEWPVWGARGTGCAFDEIAIRHGDFAMASAAAQLTVDAAGVCRRAAFGLGGVDGVPRSFPELARRLEGQRLDDALLRDVASEAAADCDPGSDLHASAEYRRDLARVLAARVLRQAADAAQSSISRN